MNNIIGRIEFGVYGDRALFTTPESKQQGHPVSYRFPTYEALRGLCKKIYWHGKPYDLDFRINKVRVMNNFCNMETVAYSFQDLTGKQALPYCTYLKDVHYQISADIVYKDGQDHGKEQLIKAENIFLRRITKGETYAPAYLGLAECVCYVTPEKFGEGNSFYDRLGEFKYVENEKMFIKFKHCDDFRNGKKIAYFGNIKFVDGILTYPSEAECSSRVLAA